MYRSHSACPFTRDGHFICSFILAAVYDAAENMVCRYLSAPAPSSLATELEAELLGHVVILPFIFIYVFVNPCPRVYFFH